jgi:hypothetical protein
MLLYIKRRSNTPNKIQKMKFQAKIDKEKIYKSFKEMLKVNNTKISGGNRLNLEKKK